MNLECKIGPTMTALERLQAIADGLDDLEYWTPCDLTPLLLAEQVRRVEAPFGGYVLELTDRGRALVALAKGEAQ